MDRLEVEKLALALDPPCRLTKVRDKTDHEPKEKEKVDRVGIYNIGGVEAREVYDKEDPDFITDKLVDIKALKRMGLI